MEGRGPYRIYDPGGSTPLGEVSAAFERLVEENTRLKGKIQGIKMLGKADHDPPYVGPLPAACSASPLTKAAGTSAHHAAVSVTQSWVLAFVCSSVAW